MHLTCDRWKIVVLQKVIGFENFEVKDKKKGKQAEDLSINNGSLQVFLNDNSIRGRKSTVESGLLVGVKHV